MRNTDNFNPGDIFQVNHDFASSGNIWRGVYCEVIKTTKGVVSGKAISGNHIGDWGSFRTRNIRKVA